MPTIAEAIDQAENVEHGNSEGHLALLAAIKAVARKVGETSLLVRTLASNGRLGEKPDRRADEAPPCPYVGYKYVPLTEAERRRLEMPARELAQRITKEYGSMSGQHLRADHFEIAVQRALNVDH